MIEFHDVTVCYEPDKRHPVRSLDGVSLKIARGDWVFLVGPSGAGKSSLLKLIYAGMKAQSGRVVVDGENISNISARAVPTLRRKIGIVFQDFQLLSEKTAWENVAFALRVIGTPQSVIIREVPRALETVGLTHRADALPHELSGGEQQRIAIARAIVNNPPILLTDEPTGNLDPQTAREVGQLLTKINFERGTTIVMATHDGAFVDELARRVVRLKAGRIVSDCNPGLYGSDDEIAPYHMFAPSPVGAPSVVSPPVPRLVAEPAISEPAEPVALPISVPTIKKTTISPAKVEAAPAAIPTQPISEPVPVQAEPPAEPPVTAAPQVAETGVAETKMVEAEVAEAEVAAPPELQTPKPQVPKPQAPVEKPAPQATEPLIEAQPPVSSENGRVAPPRVAPSPAPNHFDPYSVDGVQPQFAPAPRPMARRIAAPVPPPQNGHALDKPAADPNAPLGSPENPIVQYE